MRGLFLDRRKIATAHLPKQLIRQKSGHVCLSKSKFIVACRFQVSRSKPIALIESDQREGGEAMNRGPTLENSKRWASIVDDQRREDEKESFQHYVERLRFGTDGRDRFCTVTR